MQGARSHPAGPTDQKMAGPGRIVAGMMTESRRAQAPPLRVDEVPLHSRLKVRLPRWGREIANEKQGGFY